MQKPMQIAVFDGDVVVGIHDQRLFASTRKSRKQMTALSGVYSTAVCMIVVSLCTKKQDLTDDERLRLIDSF